MQMKEAQETRTHQDRTAGGGTTGSRIWAINRCQSVRPEEDVREDDPAGHAVAVTTQEASDGSRQKIHESREYREQLIELGIDCISGSALT